MGLQVILQPGGYTFTATSYQKKTFSQTKENITYIHSIVLKLIFLTPSLIHSNQIAAFFTAQLANIFFSFFINIFHQPAENKFFSSITSFYQTKLSRKPSQHANKLYLDRFLTGQRFRFQLVVGNRTGIINTKLKLRST